MTGTDTAASAGREREGSSDDITLERPVVGLG